MARRTKTARTRPKRQSALPSANCSAHGAWTETWVIDPAMKLRYEKYIKPKLTLRQQRLVKKLSVEIQKRINIIAPTTSATAAIKNEY